MKKMILSAAALFVFGFASAQDKEATGTGTKGFANGDLFMTGSVGIGTSKQGDNKSTSFEIAPSVGLFVTDNIAVGARIGYLSEKAENAGGDIQDDATLAVGAFGRYYMTPKSDFSVFAELAVAYLSIEDKLADTKDKGFGVGLSPGISYFISNHFAIEASFGLLSYSSYETDGVDDKTSTFQLGADLSDINFGLIYKF